MDTPTAALLDDEVVIERRFRRSTFGELRQSRVKNLVWVGLALSLGLLASRASPWPFGGPFAAAYTGEALRVLVWSSIALLGVVVVRLASAQSRARGQAIDHTLQLTRNSVRLRNNFSGRVREFAWSDFERVEMEERHFGLRRRSAKRGEVYRFDRRKLNPRQERWLAERMLAL